MSTRGLNWQVLNWPLGFGLNQQTDKRSRPAPALDIATDVQVDEQGGLQTRYPYAAMSNSIAGGGTLSNCRRLFVSGNELCTLTSDTLYTYSDQTDKWVSKGTHLAVKVEEEPVFVSTGDQVETDRAELSGRIYYAWTDTNKVYIAAIDKDTGSVWLPPTAVGSTATRPRLVALTTKVLYFWHAGTDAVPGNIKVGSLDPTATDPITVAANIVANTDSGGGALPTVLAAATSGSYYDAVKIAGADTAIFVARRLVTTSYEIAKVTAGLAVTAATKARNCIGAIAVSVDPTGATAQVIRTENALDLKGDRITVSSLADAATAQAIGDTPPGLAFNQIAVCHRSVQDSGAYRAYVFWSAGETATSTGFETKFNFVDTAGTIGTQASLVKRTGVVSRAFDNNGRVYVWGSFACESASAGMGEPLGVRAQLQNTNFLYRDDGFLCAKAAAGRSGGFRSSTSHLPGVALVDGTTKYAFCGIERRVIPLGGASHTGYADRGPRDIKITFDSNEARRAVRLGRTVYLTGGEILQYDGGSLYEVGFHIYPWFFASVPLGVGNIPNGTYSYKSTLRWENAVGEQERSTTATGESTTVSTGPDKVVFTLAGHHHTHKTATRSAIALEIWRTAIAPPLDAPFYLVTSKDPGLLTGDNRYVANDPTAYFATVGDDNFADATLIEKEQNPENDGVLENLSPPAATIIAATDTRVLLAGVAGDPNRVWYSKQRNDGEVASFHDGNVVEVPPPGGDITAIAVREGALVVWRETACYLLPGYGFTNTADGQNFGPAQIISENVGAVNMESVAAIDAGWIFKSSKGWYLLTRSFSLEYIGGPVADYDSETILAVTVIEGQHQVRCLSASRMLVLDTQSKQWFEWKITDGLDAAMWRGSHVYLTATGPKIQGASYSGLTYGLDVETAWIKPADLQGAVSIRKIQVLGEFRSTCYLRLRLAYNYVETYVDDKASLVTPAVVGGPLQIKHGPKRPRCQSFKVRLTAVALATLLTATELSGTLALSVGNWTATLAGVVPRTISIVLFFDSVASIEVRDNEDYVAGAWTSDPGNCGVFVTGNNTTATVTIAALEAAINATSQLVAVTVPHGTPSSTINMAGSPVIGEFPVVTPTGEAIKLTGLAFEVGSERPGLYNRLPASQRQ